MHMVDKWLIGAIVAVFCMPPVVAAAQEDSNFMSAIQLVANGNAEIDAGKFARGAEICGQVRAQLAANPAASQINSDLATGAADICVSIALFKSGSSDSGGGACDYLVGAANVLLPASESEGLPQNFKDFVVGLLKAASEQDRLAGCGIFP